LSKKEDIEKEMVTGGKKSLRDGRKNRWRKTRGILKIPGEREGKNFRGEKGQS